MFSVRKKSKRYEGARKKHKSKIGTSVVTESMKYIQCGLTREREFAQHENPKHLATGNS